MRLLKEVMKKGGGGEWARDRGAYVHTRIFFLFELLIVGAMSCIYDLVEMRILCAIGVDFHNILRG